MIICLRVLYHTHATLASHADVLTAQAQATSNVLEREQ